LLSQTVYFDHDRSPQDRSFRHGTYRKDQNEITPRGKLVNNGPRGNLRDGLYQKEKFERFGKKPAGLKNSSTELDLGFFNPEKHAKPEPMFIGVKNLN
jgi:hypothetical protein